MGIPLFKPGQCNTCSQPIGEFRDELSRREFDISGMCQACQNSVFDVCECCGMEFCECEQECVQECEA